MGRAVIGKTSDFPPDKMQKISVDGKDVLVLNLDGSYYGIDDTCTHMGASLVEGQLEGSMVICGWHGANLDCKSGKLEKFPAKINDLKSYKVVIESNDVILEA